MACLEHVTTGRRVPLGSEDLLGRGPLSDVRLAHPAASARHASVRFAGDEWQIKDLGSSNGTRLDGVRVEPGQWVTLRAGAVVELGHQGERWRLVDDAPPSPMARVVGTDHVVFGGDGMLALPDADDPDVVCIRRPGGGWVIERGEKVEDVRSGELVDAGGRTYKLDLPGGTGHNTLRATELRPTPRDVGLRFAVSTDQEIVEAWLITEDRVIPLGVRAHHEVLWLLALARERDDREARLPEPERGWMHVEELLKGLRVGENKLNVSLFRARKQLAEAGLDDAAGIVERRPQTRQLRLAAAWVEHVRM